MVASAALMNPLMTRHAERHQIVLIMCATIGERLDMMHKRRENVSALLLALFTKRIRCQVSVAYFLPRTSIPLVLIVAAREVVIIPLHRFLVRLAVAAFSIRQVRTARHAAGALRPSRHRFTSTMASKKPSRRIASPRRLIPYPILAESIISLSR